MRGHQDNNHLVFLSEKTLAGKKDKIKNKGCENIEVKRVRINGRLMRINNNISIFTGLIQLNQRIPRLKLKPIYSINSEKSGP